jgi:hypothetical protein
LNGVGMLTLSCPRPEKKTPVLPFTLSDVGWAQDMRGPSRVPPASFPPA